MSSNRSISKLSELTDGQLINNYINKNSNKSFTVLHNRYKNEIYGFILKMVKNKQDANDVYQKTYLKIIEKIGDVYDHTGKFKSWAMTIAYNNCIDFFRFNKKFVDPEALVSDDFDFFESIEDNETPDKYLVDEEERDILKKEMKKLDITQQDVINYRNDGVLYKDIAKKEDVSINTALGRMRYARINLEKACRKYNKTAGDK